VGAKPDRGYVIGAFLALLELVKLRKVRVVQESATGDIAVKVHEDAMQPEGAVDRDLAAAQALEASEPKTTTGLRVVFMGSPAFAVPALRSLCGAGMAPVLVVTQPDREAGRGKRLRATAVALAADELNLAVLKSADVNGRDARDEIGSATPDVIVTAGFGQKLGGTLLSLPPRGCVNVHASLLPLYRGASPIAAAIRDGQRVTGVTLIRMDEHLDRGPVLATVEVPIGPDDTLEDVSNRMAEAGADLLVRTLPRGAAGEIDPVEQDHARAPYVKKLTTDDGVIDLTRSAEKVRDHIRAMAEFGRHDALDVAERRDAAAGVAPRGRPRGVAPPVAVGPGFVIAAGKTAWTSLRDGCCASCASGPAASRCRPASSLNGRITGDRRLMRGRRPGRVGPP
jgi:methionyl-tRNA formyltransferase